jgi:hypothetical protein
MTKTRVESISVAVARPGMVLARDVLNPQGQILLQAKAELSESSITSLLRRNIGHVCVFQDDQRSEQELAAERLNVMERIDVLFHGVAQDGIMGALRQMILEYRLGGLS